MTFLLTDVEGSTRLWEEHPTVMGAVIARHDALFAEAVGPRGVLIRSKGEGDSTFSAFEHPADALVAAIDAQRALRREAWPEGIELRVRIAVYTGEAELRDGDYFGTAPNRAARLRAAAHGGQTICAEGTQALLQGRYPEGVTLRDLGLHRLRDVARAERVFQVDHQDLGTDFPPLSSLGVRHNLPKLRTRFVGRDGEVASVLKHLETERLVTLTGVGGCGKTRLAIEVASSVIDGYPDGVFFADLSPVSDSHVVAGTVAGAVGFSRMTLGTGSGRPGRELIDFLTSREVLLVVDNCEHVVDACAQLVDEILERCPKVSVLATSREALQLQGEQTYPVAPLEVPDDDDPAASDSVRLFVDRGTAAAPGFMLSDDNVAHVAEICRRLDGIPLAIELAAAHLAHLTPRQIVERLADRFQLLTGGRRRARRQQTLHAALDWSYDLLDDDERSLLRRLAVFPGTFSHDAAEAVGGARAFELLRALIEKSLVTTDTDGSEFRYRLLETVRMYSEEKLVEAGENTAARDGHRDHYLVWAESIPTELTYLDAEGVIRRERHNLRAALRWSEQQGRLDLVGRLASTMTSSWFADIREGRRWLALGMEAVDELEAGLRVRVVAVAALVAVLAIEAADGELARRAVEAAEGRPGMWSSLAHALLCLNMGIRYYGSKNPVFAEAVEDLGRKAVELATEPISRGLAWFFLGQTRVLLDDLDGAVDGLAKGAIEGPTGGEMSVVSGAMLAGVLHIADRHAEARAAADEVLERARRHAAGTLWAWALYCVLPHALELGHEGRHAEAVAFLREIIEEGVTPRTPGVMNSVVIALGVLAVQREDYETAAVLLEFAAQAMGRSGVRTPIDIVLFVRYVGKLPSVDPQTSQRYKERAAAMSLEDVLACGLDLRRDSSSL